MDILRLPTLTSIAIEHNEILTKEALYDTSVRPNYTHRVPSHDAPCVETDAATESETALAALCAYFLSFIVSVRNTR